MQGESEHTDDFLASYAVAASSLLPPFARTSEYNGQSFKPMQQILLKYYIIAME